MDKPALFDGAFFPGKHHADFPTALALRRKGNKVPLRIYLADGILRRARIKAEHENQDVKGARPYDFPEKRCCAADHGRPAAQSYALWVSVEIVPEQAVVNAR